MAQLDVVIRGGTVVDGTGVPRYQADVGIKNGRVARVSGRIQGGGAREIDARGCIVAPGAIDLHTHYDAQLNWDPYATLSGWFGVTSVSIGQCGFGFAPTRPEDRDLTNPFSHISLSDGGAHIRYLTISTWPVHFLSYWVRDKQLLSLEQAHYKMSSLPAWLANFRERGTLRIGDWADIMVYNLEELGYVYAKPTYASDFPGGEWRRMQKPTGMRYILVNGAVTFESNNCTGALPGKLLRSYDMID